MKKTNYRNRPKKKRLTRRQLVLEANWAIDRLHAMESLDAKRADEQRAMANKFKANAKAARERARSAWRCGRLTTHSKLCAVARVWEMAAAEVPEDDLPF